MRAETAPTGVALSDSERSAVHMQKLAVGLSSVDALRRRVTQRTKSGKGKHVVLTRMMPRRADELRAGGSMFWVIGGAIRARQRILSVESFAGNKRCRITLEPTVVETEPAPRKAFQGWRYLPSDDAPGDLRQPDPDSDLDPALQRELANLGLL